MTPTDQPDAERAAFGRMTALVPEVADLVEYRRSLGGDLPSDELRDLVLTRARELGLLPGGERLPGGTELPSPLLDTTVADGAQYLLAYLSQNYGGLTLRDLLMKFSAFLKLDDMLFAYVEESAKSGRPAAFPDIYRGAVAPISPVKVGEFETGPLVFLAVTPHGNLDQLIGELRDTCYTHFRGYRTHKAETWEELALLGELKKKGMDLTEMTWHMLGLKNPEIAAASDEERKRDYKPDYTKERARIRKMLQRLDS